MMNYPRPPFPHQKQPMFGATGAMKPVPDHGETTYRGCGRLIGKKAAITGGDSGIGPAVYRRDRWKASPVDHAGLTQDWILSHDHAEVGTFETRSHLRR
jgi:hypothetical protein